MTVTYVRELATPTHAISLTGNTAIRVAWAYGGGNTLDMHDDAKVNSARRDSGFTK